MDIHIKIFPRIFHIKMFKTMKALVATPSVATSVKTTSRVKTHEIGYTSYKSLYKIY